MLKKKSWRPAGRARRWTNCSRLLRRKDELFQHLKYRIPPTKKPEFLQELCGYNDVNAVVPSNGYNVFLKRIRGNDTMIVFQR